MRRLAGLVTLLVAVTACGSSGDGPPSSSSPSGATTDRKVVQVVFAAARNGYQMLGTIDYGKRKEWAARVAPLVTRPLSYRLDQTVRSVLAADRGSRDSDTTTIDDVSMISLKRTSAVVLLAYTRVSVTVGRRASAREAIAVTLDLVGRTWKLSAASGDAPAANSRPFARTDEQQAMDAAQAQLQTLASVSTRGFDASYQAAQHVLTGAALRAYPDATAKRRELVRRRFDVINGEPTSTVGLRRPGSATITLLGGVNVKYREYPLTRTETRQTTVYRLTMTRVKSHWLISGLVRILVDLDRYRV